MKRIIAAFLCASLLMLTSCSRDASAEDVLTEFCREYPISASVYSSLSAEGEAGYIDSEMIRLLYGVDEYPTDEFALVLYGKVDTVREIGVFITKDGSERIVIAELLSRRISFLSSFSDGEGFIRKYRGVLVYGFVEDASYAEAIFDRIL